LDLGAGTGLLALTFAPLVDRVFAVDSSRTMLDRLVENAKRRRLSNVEPVAADLRSLPLADESASLAVSNYAFHHLDRAGKELALSEARRVLVPTGRLVVCDMMFALSFRRRDRSLIAEKVVSLARQGPAGVLRIGENLVRVVLGEWEHPAPPAEWERLLVLRHFDGIAVHLLEHEAAVAVARRPARTSR
jgi:ubiquinone/menaquinone biosynthesis C-methylase UbiE